MIKTVFWTVICFERLVGFNRKNIVRLFDLTFLLRQAKGLSKCKKTVKMCQKNCFFWTNNFAGKASVNWNKSSVYCSCSCLCKHHLKYRSLKYFYRSIYLTIIYLFKVDVIIMDFVHMTFLSNLNSIHLFFWYFHYWFSTTKCQGEEQLSVILVQGVECII